METLFLVGFIAFVMVLIVVAIVSDRRRRQRLEEFAQRHGLTFVRHLPDAFFEQFHGFDPFGVGDSRRATNGLTGDRNGFVWTFFDYQYSTGSGKNRSTHRYGIAAIQMPYIFPRLTMRREHFGDRIVGALGARDLQFESDEFNRTFHVRSERPEFAYQVLHPTMMEYLLSRRNDFRHWQFGGMWCILISRNHYDEPNMLKAMNDFDSFFSRVPGFVLEDTTRAAQTP